MNGSNRKIVMPVLSAFFAALISVGAYIAIPVAGSPVPIVLQNMFILLTGLVIGPVWGGVSILFYLIAGIVGLPVFSGGGKTIAHLMGPTGGYLISYLVAVVVIGILTNKKENSLLLIFGALVIGAVIIYTIGVSWLKFKLGFSWMKAISVGFFPYIIGDVFKIIIAGFLGWKLKPILSEMIA